MDHIILLVLIQNSCFYWRNLCMFMVEFPERHCIFLLCWSFVPMINHLLTYVKILVSWIFFFLFLFSGRKSKLRRRFSFFFFFFRVCVGGRVDGWVKNLRSLTTPWFLLLKGDVHKYLIKSCWGRSLGIWPNDSGAYWVKNKYFNTRYHPNELSSLTFE